MKKIFTLSFTCLFTVAAFSQTASTTVVISQVYGGGGATGGSPSYQYDFVELHNVSNISQDISGWSIQYASSTGNYASSPANLFVFPAGTIIPAGRFLLIQAGQAGTVGGAFPVTPDFTTPGTGFSMSAGAGRVALSNQSAALACGSTAIPAPCGPTDYAKIVDAVAYGNTVGTSEGRPANDSSALNNTQGVARKIFGCQDTQNNNNDFDVVTNPIPRNSATAALICSNFVVPLSLTEFRASLNEQSVQLSWASLNEQNVQGFVVERSNNGSSFSSIGNVAAANTTKSAYSFVDNNPLSGAGFYRLRMVDFDGTVKYSAVVVINNRRSISAQVFPNPTRGALSVNHPKATVGANIQIISAEGRQVKTFKVAAGTLQTNLSVSDLTNGNYLLIFDNDGAKSITKFVKN